MRKKQLILLTALVWWFAFHTEAASVWRVSGEKGQILYLGGSVHGLSRTDYPLPAAYNRAFDASSRLVLEDDPAVSRSTMQKFFKSGLYSKNDNLKNHLDPRSYDYLRRVFGLWHVPEATFQRYRPWMLIMMLWSSSTNPLGVEGFLVKRAHASNKPITGLESFHEHMEIISGMSDKQAEMVLLLTFIPQGDKTNEQRQLLGAWRRGDADALARLEFGYFADVPFLGERLINARNRNWIPKIEGYLRGNKTYFVVAGAGHMGGPDGVLALLRGRGYKIEEI